MKVTTDVPSRLSSFRDLFNLTMHKCSLLVKLYKALLLVELWNDCFKHGPVVAHLVTVGESSTRVYMTPARDVGKWVVHIRNGEGEEREFPVMDAHPDLLLLMARELGPMYLRTARTWLKNKELLTGDELFWKIEHLVST